MSKSPARLRDAFSHLLDQVMYATSEDGARTAFAALKDAMLTDAGRAVRCIEKDLDSLLTHYSFDKSCWVALRTTNAIENVNRQFKRRTKGMDTLGEKTLESVLAFTALKIELGWQKHRIDSGVFNRKKSKGVNTIEAAVEEVGLMH